MASKKPKKREEPPISLGSLLYSVEEWTIYLHKEITGEGGGDIKVVTDTEGTKAIVLKAKAGSQLIPSTQNTSTGKYFIAFHQVSKSVIVDSPTVPKAATPAKKAPKKKKK